MASPRRDHLRSIEHLHDVVIRLVGYYDFAAKQHTGCPWCATQTPEQLLGWLRSEIGETAYEMDAVRRSVFEDEASNDSDIQVSMLEKASVSKSKTSVGSSCSKIQGSEAPNVAAMKRLESEVGDLLFDVFLMAALCNRDGMGLSISTAAAAAAEKIKRRCPYIFGEEKAESVAEAEAIWQRVKREERAKKLTITNSTPSAHLEKNHVAVPGDAVVLFAKFPIRGKSKTRLAHSRRWGGEDGAFRLATAMIEDCLVSVWRAPELAEARKVILFAPSDAGPKFASLLDSLGVPRGTFDLVPMRSSHTCDGLENLTSSNLSDKLQNGLQDVLSLPAKPIRECQADNAEGKVSKSCGVRGSIAIIGMDSPEISASAIATALTRARRGAAGYICPAADGGYTLLALPAAAPLQKCFVDVEWSTDHTCLSQVGALGKVGLPTLLGPTFHDIDDANDLDEFHKRLSSRENNNDSDIPCPRTKGALLGLLEEGATSQNEKRATHTNRSPFDVPDGLDEDNKNGITSDTNNTLRRKNMQKSIWNTSPMATGMAVGFGALITLAVSSLLGVRRGRFCL